MRSLYYVKDRDLPERYKEIFSSGSYLGENCLLFPKSAKLSLGLIIYYSILSIMLIFGDIMIFLQFFESFKDSSSTLENILIASGAISVFFIISIFPLKPIIKIFRYKSLNKAGKLRLGLFLTPDTIILRRKKNNTLHLAKEDLITVEYDKERKYMSTDQIANVKRYYEESFIKIIVKHPEHKEGVYYTLQEDEFDKPVDFGFHFGSMIKAWMEGDYKKIEQEYWGKASQDQNFIGYCDNRYRVKYRT